MQILGHFCLLLTVFSVLDFYLTFLQYIFGFPSMDCVSCFKFLCQSSGFLISGCFSQLLNLLGLFLLFGLALKLLQFGSHYKGVTQLLCDLRNGGVYSSNRYADKSNRIDGNGDDTSEEGSPGEEEEEEEEVDVLALRKLVKIERERANAANLELEEERMAAATAAHEAMAMILRLQNEKSLIEMEANQYRRLAEEKQLHDQEVIQSLRWIVMKHESERSLLEHQLSSYRRRLKLRTKGGDEGDESQSRGIDHESLSSFNFTIEDGPGDALISSLDMDLSPQYKF